jgi:hypothetical protein
MTDTKRIEGVTGVEVGTDWIKLNFENHDITIDKLNIYNQPYSSLITTIESQNSQIESLKAITEIAVKGLKDVSDIDTSSYSNDSWQMRDIANGALSEIERLSHE